jgi:hypothetical protein
MRVSKSAMLALLDFPKFLFKAGNLSFQIFKLFKFALQELGFQERFFANAARRELTEIGRSFFQNLKNFSL